VQASRPGPGGWEELPDPRTSGPEVAVEVTLLGANHRLFLTPEPLRVRARREGRLLDLPLELRANAEVAVVGEALAAGDVVEHVSRLPAEDEALRLAARSDSEVSPHEWYVRLSPSTEPLRRVALERVAGLASPWARARLLEAWLKGPDFTYTLAMPEVDTKTPVVDFVLRARRGHCEYFAAALTLLLRGLGHPARIVRGFRGGDYQATRGTWLVRGTHYHAWTEMYLDGIGWARLDPTPADGDAVDVASYTRALEASRRDGEGLSSFLLGYGARERAALGAWLLDAIGVLLAAAGAAGLLALLSRRRRRPGPATRPRPRGPYEVALGALARRGIRRRRSDTPRELAAAVRLPVGEGAEELALVTSWHEATRYAGRAADAASTSAAEDAARRLGDLLRRSVDGST
jgi:transglutaminase-like putative cysteine protease